MVAVGTGHIFAYATFPFLLIQVLLTASAYSFAIFHTLIFKMKQYYWEPVLKTASAAALAAFAQVFQTLAGTAPVAQVTLLGAIAPLWVALLAYARRSVLTQRLLVAADVFTLLVHATALLLFLSSVLAHIPVLASVVVCHNPLF